MDFDKADSAGYLVNHVARLFAKGLQDRIAPLGIVIGQFPVLLELWQGDGVSQKDLLKSIDVEQATLANTLNRMERDGLIRRTKHPADGRTQQIWLTDHARALRDAAYQSANDQNASALKVLTRAERVQFNEIMRKLIAGFKADADD